MTRHRPAANMKPRTTNARSLKASRDRQLLAQRPEARSHDAAFVWPPLSSMTPAERQFHENCLAAHFAREPRRFDKPAGCGMAEVVEEL